MQNARRTFLVVAICWICTVVSCAQDSGGRRPLSADQQLELRTLTGQLTDPARSAKTRREAAALLLRCEYPQAVEALWAALSDASNRSAQIAVAQAIAARGSVRKAFVEPLMAMLTGKEPSVRAPAARALATCKDRAVAQSLIAIARDAGADHAVRLVTVSAMGHLLDKAAVDALVGLLDDRDAAIRAAAADSLTSLTNIRAFGGDPVRWKRWWAKNKDKPRTVWLADLANSLARAKSALESQNAQLRDRLAKAMQDLYAAAPQDRRDAMLLGFLKDPLLDVRLVGTTLTERKIAAGEKIGDPIRLQVRSMLADAEPPVRRAAALLTAGMGDGEALGALLGRLKGEQVPAVRQAVLTALGQLNDPKALPAVLAEVRAEDANIAAAAALALAHLAAKRTLDDEVRSQAAKTLLDRCRTADGGPGGATLREALMTAMGAVGDKTVSPALAGGLKDPVAAVRLAAVNGLAQLRDGSADIIAPLVSDPDRGVRQAVLTALGALDGAGHLPTILARTDPAVESDAGVRRQAWEIATGILAEADAGVLASVAQLLGKRKDPAVADQRIKVLGMLVSALKKGKSLDLPGAQRRLARALLLASRPAEATPHLAGAYAQCKARKSPETPAVWREWIDAMLLAEDPAVAKALADQTDDAAFAKGMGRLSARLDELAKQERFSAITVMADEALKQLGARLTDEQKAALNKTLQAARADRLRADRQAVAKLVGELSGGDDSARKAAAQLEAMGDRSVRPLVRELRQAVAAEKPDAAVEKAIVAVLTRIAPKLAGYDTSADKDAKLKLIDSWLKES